MGLLTLAAVAAAVPTGTTALPVASRVEAVTVFRHQALVVRAATASLPASGLFRLSVRNLPPRLDDGTVQARCDGDSRPVVVGVTVENAFSEEVTNVEAKALEEQLKALGRERRVINDELGQIGEQSRFLRQLRNAYVKRIALEDVTLDLKQWGKVQQMVTSGLASLAAQKRSLEEKRARVDRKTIAAQKQAQELASKRATRSRVAQVDLRARRGGAVSCQIRYLISGVSWTSNYDARQDDGILTLTHYAQVRNRSGEDWDNATLSFSTADPVRAVQVPQLYPMIVREARPVTLRTRGWGGAFKARRLAANIPRASDEAADKDGDRLREQRLEDAVFTRRALHAVFTARTRASVPSTGAPRQVALARQRFTPKLVYIAAPRVAPGAYLTAKAHHTGKLPILAGQVRLFLGDDFIGRTRIRTVVPGDELLFSFGKDERVRVERVRLKRHVSKVGFWSKETQIHQRFRIRVTNLTGKAVQVGLLDQLPVSQTEKIKVVIDEDSTPRTKPQPKDRPGTLRWNLSLADGAKAEVVFGFKVKHPVNMRVWGV